MNKISKIALLVVIVIQIALSFLTVNASNSSNIKVTGDLGEKKTITFDSSSEKNILEEKKTIIKDEYLPKTGEEVFYGSIFLGITVLLYIYIYIKTN